MNYIFMKLKLIVFAAVVSVPLLTFSQTTPTAPFLYNKGVMVVKGTAGTAAAVASSTATLYVGGDFVAGNDASTACDITLENSKTVVTGNFIHNAFGGSYKNIFKQATAATFNTSLISFEGIAQQKITTSAAGFNGNDKLAGYINFPNIRVLNTSATIDANNVWLDWRLAAQAKEVTLERGWLTLASKYYVSSGANPTNINGETYLAHFMPNSVTYNQTATNVAQKGMVEVELDLGKQTYTSADFGRLIGLGSPFATSATDRNALKADYFAWNFLLAPNYQSYFGPTGNAIANPTTDMPAGKGYILGIDLRGVAWNDYKGDVGHYTKESQFNHRVSSSASNNLYGGTGTQSTTKYIFNRYRYNNAGSTAADRNTLNQLYSGGIYADNGSVAANEKLVTGSVSVPLDEGFNFLSNPYTAPYDASDIISGITGIAPRIWLLNSNSSRGSGSLNMFPYAGTAPGNKWLQVAMYFYVSTGSTGGTFVELDLDGNQAPGPGIGFGNLIPPLQMFAVFRPQGTPATNYVFNPANRKIDVANTNFLRSTANENTRKDDFVFEVVDTKTGTNDRTNVVLRTKSEILSNSKFQNLARWATGKSSDSASEVNTRTDASQTYASQIYTKDDKNNDLIVNFLPYTKSGSEVLFTTLYLTPSSAQQNIEIKGYRLNTLSSEFDGIYLLDKVANKEIAMTPETVYKTTTKATDRTDRFVLKFTRTTTGIEDEIEETTKNISSYYANGVLTLTGFDDTDFGSSINVFDIQGRMVKQAKVDDYTVDIYESFAPGAYIVKVVGNNSYVAKFLVR